MTDDIIMTKAALEGIVERINDKSKPPIPVTMETDELKTLKDLEDYSFNYGENEYFASVAELRASAIRWVKELRKPTINLRQDNKLLLQNANEGEAEAQVRFIMHRYNLTEADLK